MMLLHSRPEIEIASPWPGERVFLTLVLFGDVATMVDAS